jgi:FtsP/CotA-like multicopper oxidase with cupredoxin domain
MSMGGKGGKPDVGDVPFESVLFNGLGRFPGMAAPMPYVLLKQGETVRLRLINASSTYAFRLQIGAYALTVIASDGAPVVPVEVDNLIFSPGERYDVLVTANQSRPSLIRVATLAGDEGEAILHVDPSNKHPAVLMNWGPRSLTLEALRSPGPVQLASQAREVRLRLGGTMRPYSWNINHQEYPHAEPIAAAKDEWLRFVLDNPTGMDHPFHLHGHYFFVLGPPDRLNLVDPPRKDTVNVPAGGRLVLLWKANNPGRWFFHCHIEWHVATGMARVIDIAR